MKKKNPIISTLSPKDYKIGNRIRSLRIDKGLTQTDLGNLIGVGLKQICSYENNKLFPPIQTCITLCSIFNCSMDYLIIGTEKDTSKVLYNEGYRKACYDFRDGINRVTDDLLKFGGC